MNVPMPCGVTADLRRHESETDKAYAAAEEIEDQRDELVMDYLEKISSDAPEIGDFLGGYLAADPQAMTALVSVCRLSRLALGKEENREAMLQAATRFAQLTLDCADGQFGDWLVREELDK